MRFLPRSCLALLLAACALAQAPPGRTCATMEVHEAELQANPFYAAARAGIEAHTQAVGMPESTILVTIPVVVHIVYNTAAENLSLAQIQSQIDVLNEDFRRLNADAALTQPQWQPLAADVEVNFCLATIDPQGQPTSGITRTATAVTSFGTNNAIKSTASGGRDPWPSSQYLNVWVGDLSGGLLGYATFPGSNPALDGVVIDYQAFGRTGTATAPFHLGRTTTHEVGHWLNLIHIWGDSSTCGVDDLVADTPDSNQPTSGCTPSPAIQCGIAPMFQNYMDYSNDSCMNLFTQGQKARMQALFSPGGARYAILSSPGCGPTTPQYQVNQALASFAIDGIQGTSLVPAVKSLCTGQGGTIQLSAAVFPGTPYDVGVSFQALVPAGSGGLTTPAGQIINLDLASSIFLSTGTPALLTLPWPGNHSVPFVSSLPGTLAFQMVVFAPVAPEGFALSQGSQLLTISGAPTFPAGPTGDDTSVLVTLPATSCPPSIIFYGTAYTSFGVSSNGRVLMGGTDNDFSPTISETLGDLPSVGFWSDFNPAAGGSILISSPATGVVRVLYNGIRYYGETNPNTFAVEFGPGPQVMLDGLAGIVPNSGTTTSDSQWLGICRGLGQATNAGSTLFTVGGSGTPATATAAIYDFYNAATQTGGLVSSLQGTLNRITFTPAPNGNYTWMGY